MNYLKIVAVSGNILFILWMSFNAIDEAFKGTIYQKISYVGLVSLLLLNIFLLFRRK
ncbi:MAG TPA: hypothetical protein VFA93_02970 [Patescibacteria group bacterium]|nr:hypothetical protein [Patescibacteria group bacterium]